LNQAGVGTTPPQLLGLSVAPPIVDVTHGPTTLTITLAVSDQGGSGVAVGRSWVLLDAPDFSDHAKRDFTSGDD
jgi:hypothetical protein